MRCEMTSFTASSKEDLLHHAFKGDVWPSNLSRDICAISHMNIIAQKREVEANSTVLLYIGIVLLYETHLLPNPRKYDPT